MVGKCGFLRHTDILAYTDEIGCQVKPWDGLNRDTGGNEPMVFDVMVFVGDIRNVRVDGVYLAEFADQVAVQAASDCQRVTVIIDKGRAETVDIGRFQVGVAYVVAVIGGLEPVRVERIEGRTFDVACVLSDQHPGLQVVEGIGGA